MRSTHTATSTDSGKRTFPGNVHINDPNTVNHEKHHEHIDRIPSLLRGLTHAKALYSLNGDGTISVTNSGIKAGKAKESKGKAKVTTTAGLLRVSFFGPFYSDYRVMMLSDDYSYAPVGSGNAKYLWILSRTPELPGDVLKKILAAATARGYDTSKLIWVNQSGD